MTIKNSSGKCYLIFFKSKGNKNDKPQQNEVNHRRRRQVNRGFGGPRRQTDYNDYQYGSTPYGTIKNKHIFVGGSLR